MLEASPSHVAGGTVVPSQDSLIGDLLTMDLGGPPASVIPSASPAFASSGLDLLSGGLDGLLSDAPVPAAHPPAPAAAAPPSVGLLGDIFGLTTTAPTAYVTPKQVITPFRFNTQTFRKRDFRHRL